MLRGGREGKRNDPLSYREEEGKRKRERENERTSMLELKAIIKRGHTHKSINLKEAGRGSAPPPRGGGGYFPEAAFSAGSIFAR